MLSGATLSRRIVEAVQNAGSGNQNAKFIAFRKLLYTVYWHVGIKLGQTVNITRQKSLGFVMMILMKISQPIIHSSTHSVHTDEIRPALAKSGRNEGIDQSECKWLR